MDEIDRDIIDLLLTNGRMSIRDISKTINLSNSSTGDRIKKLETSGIIKGYTTVLEPSKFNKNLICFCVMILSDHKYSNKFREFVCSHSDIVECYCVSGEYEYLIKIMTDSTNSVEKILVSLRNNFGVIKSHTYAVLGTIKNQSGMYYKEKP